MKITAQEEYGLRILIRIAACRDKDGLSIPQLSGVEGLSSHYVAKLARLLRMQGFINSTPGYKGGYVLARPAGEILIGNVLKALSGSLFDDTFCGLHVGMLKLCSNSVDCSVRSLWQNIQYSLDQLLDKITLADLVSPEKQSAGILQEQLPANSYTSLTLGTE